VQILALALLLAAEAIPRGAPGKTVAVLEFEGQLPASDGVDRVYFSDQVRGAIGRTLPKARLMTRENVVQLLSSSEKTQGRTLADCSGECEVETGRLLGADLIVSGRFTKVGARFKLSLRLHSTADGLLISSATAGGETVEKLDDATNDAVADLLATIAEPREAPRPAQGSGAQGPAPALLIVESVPSHARVLIDGRERGAAPISIEGLAPGKHLLRLELDDHQSTEQEVVVQAAQTGRARVTLARLTGRLTVESTLPVRCEAGEVSRSISAGGLELFELPVGVHEVRCTASGYQQFRERTTVKAGQTSKVRVSLDREAEAPSGPSRNYGPLVRSVAGALLLGGGGYLIADAQQKARNQMRLTDGTENQGTPMFALSLALGVLPSALATATWGDGDTLGVPFALGAGLVSGVTTAAVLQLWFTGQSGAKVPALGSFGADHWTIVGGAALGATGASLLVQGLRQGFDLAPERTSKPKAHALLWGLGGAAVTGLGGLLVAQRLQVAKGTFVPSYDGDTFPADAWVGLGALGSLISGAVTAGAVRRAEGNPWLAIAGGTAGGAAVAVLISGLDHWTFGLGMGLVGTGVGMMAGAALRGGDDDLASNTFEWAPSVVATHLPSGEQGVGPGIVGRF
jgi:hypothetical protein